MPECLIYITTKDESEAISIGRDLVENQLVACVNVYGAMTSIYKWQHELKEDREAVLIAKTTSGLVNRLTKRVVELHSYECPCVVSLPITGGFAPFLEWINAQTLSDEIDNNGV